MTDDIFCVFQGHIENVAHLKQQYGLGKNANEVIIVLEAYRTLRDRGPYLADQVLRDFHGKFAFVLYDGSTKSAFVAADADGSVPFFWGTDSEGDLVISDDLDVVSKSCKKSFAPFPKGFLLLSIRLPNYEIESYLVFDPRSVKSSSSSGSSLKGPFKVAIVFMIGGGNYVEYSLQELAQSHQPIKNVIYGTTEILTGGEFVEQLAVLGQKMGLPSSVVTSCFLYQNISSIRLCVKNCCSNGVNCC